GSKTRFIEARAKKGSDKGKNKDRHLQRHKQGYKAVDLQSRHGRNKSGHNRATDVVIIGKEQRCEGSRCESVPHIEEVPRFKASGFARTVQTLEGATAKISRAFFSLG